jgi:hypothetical protein
MPDLIRHPVIPLDSAKVAPDGLKNGTTCPAFAGMTNVRYLSAGLIIKLQLSNVTLILYFHACVM